MLNEAKSLFARLHASNLECGSRKSAVWTVLGVLIPLIVWGLLLFLRPKLVNLQCLKSPIQCEKLMLYPGDQMSVGLNVPHADEISLWTQIIAGAFAFGIPLVLLIAEMMRRRSSIAVEARACVSDWLFLAQVTVLNGASVELVRIIVQRPRPFVYEAPLTLGANPWHYNSFVSGHTSFAAAMGMAALLLLVRRRASFWLVTAAGLIAASLVFTTGACRILSGRHFLTDVISAFIVGSIVAAFVFRLREKATAKGMRVGPQSSLPSPQ